MNPPTTRQPAPAAPARSGRSSSALPSDPGLDSLLADPRLGSTAKAIALVLVKNWAWYKPSCYPSDKTIARKVGKSPGHVQRCLRQLEAAGYVAREHTAEVPSGRRIWLLWRCPDGGRGARPAPAPARGRGSAPARSEQVVVEPEEVEQADRPAPRRQRPEVPAPAADSRPGPATATANLMGLVMNRAAAAITRAAQDAPSVPPTPPTVAPPDPPPPAAPRAPKSTSEPSEMARPLTTEGLAYGSEGPRARAKVLPPPTPPVADPAVLSALTPEEQARFWQLPEATRRRVLTWLGLDDRICLGEAKKLLAPPLPPEPPPSSLSTPELLACLPGRPDWVAAAARRLCEELGDHRPASWTFFKRAAEAVAMRAAGPGVLLDCLRQATGPKAVHGGKVFVAAWKREARIPG
jgi:hypothetical protein